MCCFSWRRRPAGICVGCLCLLRCLLLVHEIFSIGNFVLWHWSMSNNLSRFTRIHHKQSIVQNIWGYVQRLLHGEMCKYFGIDKVEESVTRCHSIFARLWCFKLLILYYCLYYWLFILCVFFLGYHVMVNKVVYWDGAVTQATPAPFSGARGEDCCAWHHLLFNIFKPPPQLNAVLLSLA